MIIRIYGRLLTELNQSWLDYKNAYAIVTHNWISKTMGMSGVAENMKKIVKESIRH